MQKEVADPLLLSVSVRPDNMAKRLDRLTIEYRIHLEGRSLNEGVRKEGRNPVAWPDTL